MALEPVTLQQAILYFADPVNCREYLVKRRWPNGVCCPRCGSANVAFLEKYNRWQCREKHKAPQFTLKTGTIMEDSPLPLSKWMLAMWQVVNCKNGVSSYEISRATGVTQKSTWFMDHRIRHALGMGPVDKLSGDIEADETMIGGKARFMHKDVRARKITGTGGKDKTPVMGILQRGGKVRTKVIPHTKKSVIHSEIRKHVEAGSNLYTDALKSYDGLTEFQHQVIDHAVRYVDGKIHTNGLENFWSLLKRGLKGTYVSVEPFHLFRYLDEQVYRYNHRKGDNDEPLNDGQRFDIAVRQMVGKRLTWDHLTGKESPPTEALAD